MSIPEEILGEFRVFYDNMMREEKAIKKAIKKGIKRGLEEGKLYASLAGIRNMVKRDFDNQVIAELFDVTDSFVQMIRIQLEKEAQIIVLLQDNQDSIGPIAKNLAVIPQLVQVIKDSLKKIALQP